jgi:hypothetical protein
MVYSPSWCRGDQLGEGVPVPSPGPVEERLVVHHPTVRGHMAAVPGAAYHPPRFARLTARGT